MDYYNKISLEDKLEELEALKTLKSRLTRYEQMNLNIDNEIVKLNKSIYATMCPVDVSKEKIIQMFKGFFANNNPCLDNLLKTADYAQFAKTGLPLAYSRESFLEDLNSILGNVSQYKREIILQKLNISTIEDCGKIIGYNGIINLQQLQNEGIEGQVLLIANKFIKENSIKTGDVELDKALNSLIEGIPEFINIIGKKQHKTHDYTLDIHILTTLKESMNHPCYKNLTNEEKFCLKLTATLHDIAKEENIVDKEHPYLSAMYAKNILSKKGLTIDNYTKNRIFELIKNHHWLENYNKNIYTPKQVAALFRKKGDLKIAQILAAADLKAVKENGSYFESYKSALNKDKQALIEDEINKINTTGQLFLPNKIINPEKVPKVEYKGKIYQIIDFTKLQDNEDLSKFGFEPNSTKKNLRLLIHMVNNDNNLRNVYYLKDASNEGFLCASYVSIDKHPTYYNYNYGVSLETHNANIANATKTNQHSNGKKKLDDFINFIINEERKEIYRSTIPNSIKNSLNLSDDEYCSLYEQIQNYKFISQLDNDNTISIGDKTLSYREIKDAIINANDSIIGNFHNETNLYTPKTNALVAKVNSIEEIPQELLDYAQEYDKVIYVLGE